MRETWLIGVNVFRQLMRNRILAVLAAFALCLAGLSFFLGDLGQEAEARLARDFGLLAIEWVGFFTILLCHVVLLFEETELKTISILLVKPVKRWQYLAGKFVGSALLLAMNQALIVTLLGILGAGRGYSVFEPVFLTATVFLYLGCLLFSVVCLFFTIFASTVPACATYAAFAFMLGHFTSNLLDWIRTMENPVLEKIVYVLYCLVPNFELFNLKDNLHLTAEQMLVPEILGWPLVYLLCYGGAVAIISLRLYERKEY